MENDPSKKESKGKRILKKALRRNSKSSNNNSNSADSNVGPSRSKNSPNKRPGVDINDTISLSTTDVNKKNENDVTLKAKVENNVPDKIKKSFVEPITNANKTSTVRFDKKDEHSAVAHDVKRNLKRKLEEESGAGTSGASTGASDTDADDKDPSKDKKKKNRCAVCRKKVGLTGFECRCGGLFCAVHRYSDKHDCSFDYRELGAQEIRRNNPVVVSQKIHKI